MRPDLPDYGAYLRWPQAGTDWIHEEDRALAEAWIPSPRVFRRTGFDGEYYTLVYGKDSIRVRPSMWLRVPSESIEVGDQVEILSHFGVNEPLVGRVTEKHYRTREQRIVYLVQNREHVVPRWFAFEDLQPLETRHHLRELDRITILPDKDSPDL